MRTKSHINSISLSIIICFVLLVNTIESETKVRVQWVWTLPLHVIYFAKSMVSSNFHTMEKCDPFGSHKCSYCPSSLFRFFPHEINNATYLDSTFYFIVMEKCKTQTMLYMHEKNSFQSLYCLLFLFHSIISLRLLN